MKAGNDGPGVWTSSAGQGAPDADDSIVVGIDVVDVARFERLVAMRGPALVDRVFTAVEVAQSKGRPARMAAQLAAKEAAAKALSCGIGPIGWRDVEMRRVGGRTSIHLSGEGAALAARRGLSGWAVSLAPLGPAVMALVTAVGRPLSPDTHGWKGSER